MTNLFFNKLPFIVALFAYTCAVAQYDIQWQKSFGGSNIDQGQALHQIDEKNYFLVGSTRSVDQNISSSLGELDIWVSKLDGDKKIVWEKNIGGNGFDFASASVLTKDGLLVAGYSTSTDQDISNKGAEDLFIFKIDETGNIAWKKTYGGSKLEIPYRVKQTKDEGFVIVGVTSSDDGDIAGANGGDDVWLVKLDSNGELKWEQTYGGSGFEAGFDVIEKENGGYVVGGYATSTDGDVSNNFSGDGFTDLWLFSTDESGDVIWEKTWGGSLNETASKLTLDKQGNIVVLGNAQSEDGDVEEAFGFTDLWLLNITPNGALNWQKNIGGSENDFSTDIAINKEGNFVVLGYSNSNDDSFDNSYGDYDNWIWELDDKGEVIVQQNYGGSSQDITASMTALLNGNFVITGYSYSSDIDVSENLGEADIWILEVGEEVSTGEGIIGVSPSEIDFQQVMVDTKAEDSFTIKNLGDADLTVEKINVQPEVFSTDFADAIVIKPGEEATINVFFEPTAGGAYEGNIEIFSDAGSAKIGLVGEGVEIVIEEPVLVIEPGSSNFGDVLIDNTNSLSLEISNSGLADLIVEGFEFSSTAFSSDATGFTIAPGGEAQSIEISFTPTIAVQYQGELTIKSNVADKTILLKGTGIDEMSSIEDLTISELLVAPNPFTDFAIVKFENPNKKTHSLQLINAMGKICKEYKNIQNEQVRIERDGLVNGVYFYQLFDEVGSVVGLGKIMIQ